ncbi:GbsR/MarR family transcriptional regulator [Microbacterium sp. CH-015]|uniref:GbsR/MarR family transcriptional regulator n=1 Tax=Microbacterium sp. CH-015 TaxID=3406734 RepID=UPI003C7543B0
MATDAELTFADHAGRFYAREYSFPPVAGRLLGYLAVCDPPKQSITELSEALLASRSAISQAVKLLEDHGSLIRGRAAGQRTDYVSIAPGALSVKRDFEGGVYAQMADLAREGLALLDETALPERRAVLEEMAALGDFLAERLPAVFTEWETHREQLRKNGTIGADAEATTA